MNPQEFVSIYPYLCDNVEPIGFTLWVDGIVDHNLTLHFDSEYFFITENIKVPYQHGRMPKEFYQYIARYIETNSMTYIIIEDDKIVFKKPSNKLEIENCQVSFYRCI